MTDGDKFVTILRTQYDELTSEATDAQALRERIEAECRRWDAAPVQTPKAVVLGVRAALAAS